MSYGATETKIVFMAFVLKRNIRICFEFKLVNIEVKHRTRILSGNI